MSKAGIFVLSFFAVLAMGGAGGAYAAKQQAAKPAVETKSDQANKPDQGKESANKPPRVVMVKLNGEEITVEEYVNFLQHNPVYLQSSVSSAEGKVNAVRAMVANQLLRDDMMRKGMLPKAKKPTVAELKEAYEKLAAEKFPLPSAPDDDTAYKFYQAHQNEYGIPDMVRISQIQFKTPEGATPEQKAAVKQRAEAALKRLNGGENFSKLAGELTENPLGKAPQGDLGFLPRTGDPWLTKAIENLKVGDHTQVLESSAGYEILMVTDVRSALISPYPNVRQKIMERIRAEGQAKLRDAYVKDLAKGAKIEIVQEELKPLFAKGFFQ